MRPIPILMLASALLAEPTEMRCHKDQAHAFAFVGGSLRLRGASAAPIRPVAIAFC